MKNCEETNSVVLLFKTQAVSPQFPKVYDHRIWKVYSYFQNIPSEGALALALAFALRPEVSAHAAHSFATLGKLHLSIRSTVISPSCTPVPPEL